MKRLSLAALVVAGALVALLVLLHALASPRETIVEPIAPSSHKRLVVMVHGLSGRTAFEPAVATAREALPDSDILVFDYDAGLFSNADPYDIANRIETAIHEATQNKRYERIVLIGHSLGGMLLRKTLLWGHGLEQDRSARKGARQWVDQVERFVSLAAVNRGWSVDPAPEKMGLGRYLAIVAGERLARWSMSGGLLLAMQRGAPFVADARLQWIDLARDPARRLPQTIHLLGDQDDIVSRRDAADIGVAKNTVFVTLPQTDHAGIASALQGDASPAGVERRSRIVAAMRGEIDSLDSDRDQGLAEDPTVTRLVFVMHGIRDYGDWSDHLRDAIEREARSSSERTAVVAAKYGHFPMLPFLLYWDRQRNVRWFMDELTQNKARYPKLRTIDYVGHSNGTYILASALAHYQSIRVDRVYFAGSVVPKHYDWRTLIDSGRVGQVANVVAADDWVVALFPRLFEQIAEWAKRKPRDGPLDIGSAGFRGFDASQDASEKIRNYKFADGGHGVGVDTRAERTVEAIARFVIHADTNGLESFRQRDEPAGWLDLLSNVSWAVWLVLAVILFGIGRVLFKRSRRAAAWYAAIVLALLYSL